jgi:hypothetical protein
MEDHKMNEDLDKIKLYKRQIREQTICIERSNEKFKEDMDKKDDTHDQELELLLKSQDTAITKLNTDWEEKLQSHVLENNKYKTQVAEFNNRYGL